VRVDSHIFASDSCVRNLVSASACGFCVSAFLLSNQVFAFLLSNQVFAFLLLNQVHIVIIIVWRDLGGLMIA
jgi:hypothetical protein